MRTVARRTGDGYVINGSKTWITNARRAGLVAVLCKTELFASEACMEIALDAIRIHGGNGYSTEFDVERYFRDAPLMIVGEVRTRSSAPSSRVS